jgi:glyoxylase-like metal-dependent hydrolase (beta-lactamase superfamily II)
LPWVTSQHGNMTKPQPAIPEITPAELVRAAESGDAFQVLDIRAPERLVGGHIDILPAERFFNIAGSRLRATPSIDATGLDRSAPVAVVCGHGNSSKGITAFLVAQGFDARSVTGGMAEWMRTTIPRELPTPLGFGRLVQIDRIGKGALGYVAIANGEALIVDPPRHAGVYLDVVREANARVVGVADTHVHADYISGASALAEALCVPYYLHPADNSYPYDGTPGRLEITPLAEGRRIPVGQTSVAVWHTPGHTEGSVTYVLADQAALTGDFLFVHSIGRPDLGGKTTEWVGALWDSLERARRDLSRHTMIYPAHYASAAERREDRTVGATFASLLEHNEPVGQRDRTTFVDWVVSRQAPFPDAYRQIKAINVGIRRVSDDEADVLEMGKNECAVT